MCLNVNTAGGVGSGDDSESDGHSDGCNDDDDDTSPPLYDLDVVMRVDSELVTLWLLMWM